MRTVKPIFLVLLAIVVAGVATFFFWRARQVAAYGPAVTRCPGPDLYGYTCASGAGYAYIEATNDTELYLDDGLVALALPFPFTFYGTSYNRVYASSNGNLQFTSQNPAYSNRCLDEAPDPALGEMIAPYWTDLDLTHAGFLKYETIGAAPDRIFVVEWQDAPLYSSPADRVTFAVQLFEGSNDIVFLYREVNTHEGHNGSNATIGLQSAAHGLALQYGCNRPVVTNAMALRFPHPATPNRQVGLPGAAPLLLTAPAGEGDDSTAVKEDVARLLAALNRGGLAAIPPLQREWLAHPYARHSRWQTADVTGDGRDELIFLWRGVRPYPELTKLLILAETADGQWRLLFADPLANRRQPLAQADLYAVADVTGDGRANVLLHDRRSGQLLVAGALSGPISLVALPDSCRGGLAVRDVTGDGRLEIARDGCSQPGRAVFGWDGQEFRLMPLK